MPAQLAKQYLGKRYQKLYYCFRFNVYMALGVVSAHFCSVTIAELFKKINKRLKKINKLKIN